MKTPHLQNWFVATGVAIFLTGSALAQDSATANSTINVAPQLSYGVPQVLQLSQAKVSDGIIVNYIQNSGTIYALDANQIVYLKQQGVSDTVLNAMMDQRSRITGSTEPTTTTASSTAVDQTPVATAPPATSVTYVQTVPASNVYIIPDSQTVRYDNWYYGSYPYGCYTYPVAYYPAVSVSFGIGGRWGGGWHGGYHGGFHHGWHR